MKTIIIKLEIKLCARTNKKALLKRKVRSEKMSVILQP